MIKSSLIELEKQKKLNEEKLEKEYEDNLGIYKVWTVPQKDKYIYYKKEENKRTYIKQSELPKASVIVQNEYLHRLEKVIKKQEKLIDNFLESYCSDCETEALNKMSEGKRFLVKRISDTDEQFIAKWTEKHSGMQNGYPQKGTFKTQQGEMVRSKSEKIIADLLYQKGIPYQYEPELMLGNRRVYPDFVVLNLKERKTIYWEHLGRGDDEEYASTNLYKIHQYETNGYLQGDNLIVTREFRDMPLNIELIMKKLELYDLI